MRYLSNDKEEKLTTAGGATVIDNQNSMSAGPRGPLLVQDVNMFEKLAYFNQEGTLERAVHVKDAGAHGTFTVTDDITKYTKAIVFSEIGKATDVFLS